MQRAWKRPDVQMNSLHCVVNLEQSPAGEILTFEFGECNANEAERSALEKSLKQASPLPAPDRPDLFDKRIEFVFEP